MSGGLGRPGGSGGVEQDQPGLVGGGVLGEVRQDGGVGVGGVVDDDQRPRLQCCLAACDLGVGVGDCVGGCREAVGDGRFGLFSGGAAPQEVSVGGESRRRAGLVARPCVRRRVRRPGR